MWRCSTVFGFKKKYRTAKQVVTLWIDRPDAAEIIDNKLAANEITAKEAELLKSFARDGYVVLKNAVAEDIIDGLLQDIQNMYLQPEKYVVKHKENTVHPHTKILPIKTRALDIYVPLQSARQAIFSKTITRFLNLLYGEPPMAFQSLMFTWGSEQSMHRDTVVVITDPPQAITASWIALEDILPGSGELTYFRGSHKDDNFYFIDNKLSWNPKKDGKLIYKTYTDFLHRQAKKRHEKPSHFIANKGDVLIWHAALVHGGGPITVKDKTRYSLVTHYIPHSAQPKYFNSFPELKTIKSSEDGNAYYCSRQYKLDAEGELKPLFK